MRRSMTSVSAMTLLPSASDNVNGRFERSTPVTSVGGTCAKRLALFAEQSTISGPMMPSGKLDSPVVIVSWPLAGRRR